MPWKNKGLPPGVTANPVEAGLLRRLQQAARMARYNADEAEDISRAGVEAASRHIETTCPDMDFIVIGSVPFGADARAGKGPGNAISQRITGGPLLGASMREDVIPQQARYFTESDSAWTTFTSRLLICWKILFGANPEGYSRKDL